MIFPNFPFSLAYLHVLYTVSLQWTKLCVNQVFYIMGKASGQ